MSRDGHWSWNISFNLLIWFFKFYLDQKSNFNFKVLKIYKNKKCPSLAIKTSTSNSPMKKNNFNIDILSILVKKVFQEMWHRLVGDVTTDHDMSVRVCVLIFNYRQSISQNRNLIFHSTKWWLMMWHSKFISTIERAMSWRQKREREKIQY
jgi:hypothetical protein